jgi:hypothetical protein
VLFRSRYLASALSPARVNEVRVDDDQKSATVIVPDNQLSLAIGKEGQNVRLAARLTGWRIDIRSEAQIADIEEALYAEEQARIAGPVAAAPDDGEGLIGAEEVAETPAEFLVGAESGAQPVTEPPASADTAPSDACEASLYVPQAGLAAPAQEPTESETPSQEQPGEDPAAAVGAEGQEG